MGVMSVAYTTINGKIVSEKRNGVPSDYIPDALGSTIALLSDTHQITDSWTYWPNGQVRTRTGTNVTPHTFCGTVGYHSDIVNNLTYVQARILRPELARWQTIDRSWPKELPFNYCLSSPATVVDPTGGVAIAIGLIFVIPGVGEAALTVCGVVVAAVAVGAVANAGINYLAKRRRTNRSLPLLTRAKPKPVRLPPPPPGSGCDFYCLEATVQNGFADETLCFLACIEQCTGGAPVFSWNGQGIVQC